MYKILTFENGQPFILYGESKKVFMYTISGGRINPAETIFNDVKSNFEAYSCNKNYVGYLSTAEQFRLYKNENNLFIEIFTSEKYDVYSQPIIFNNQPIIFYSNNSISDIYCFNGESPGNRTLSMSFNSKINKLETFILSDILYLIISGDNYTHTYQVDCNYKLVNSKRFSSPNNEDIDKLKTLLEIKDEEIKKYQKTQQYIQVQYNDLADYAGKLQDELRKFRYL